MYDLSMQIGNLHSIGVAEGDGPYARRGEVQSGGRSQTADADDEHLGVLELRLPFDAEGWEREMAYVSLQLECVELFMILRGVPRGVPLHRRIILGISLSFRVTQLAHLRLQLCVLRLESDQLRILARFDLYRLPLRGHREVTRPRAVRPTEWQGRRGPVRFDDIDLPPTKISRLQFAGSAAPHGAYPPAPG